MHISIDTSQEISDLDKQVLALLGGAFFEAAPTPAPAPEEKPAPKAAAKPSGAAKKADAPKAAPKAPKPVEEPESEPEEDATERRGDDEGVDRSPKGAYDLAAKMLSKGKQGEVKAALTAAGVKKVSLLDEDNVEAFFEALGV